MQSKRRILFLVLVLTVVLLCMPLNSFANSKYASLVIDGDSGAVLHQENAGSKRYPASLTKVMTLYLTFEALSNGKLKIDQKLKVSSKAANQAPSKMGLRSGETITVRDAIISLIIKSANDCAVVLAEGIAGSEWQFALMMNQKAKDLGMNHTNFRNASGLHDSRQVTTAFDLARLAVAIRRDFPGYYHLFSRTQFTYKGKTINTHNRVLKKYPGADGLKTGYVNASGFNLITTVDRGGRRLVGVVMGGKTSRSRDIHMIKLLDQASYLQASLKQSSAYAAYNGDFIPVPVFKDEALKKRVAEIPVPITKDTIMSAEDAPIPQLKSEGGNR